MWHTGRSSTHKLHITYLIVVGLRTLPDKVPSLLKAVRVDYNDDLSSRVSLGAEGVLPSRQIESFLRVFKQFAHTLPSRQVVG